MEKVFLFIKHRLRVLWIIIEWGNSQIFTLIFKRRMEHVVSAVLKEYSKPTYIYRKLISSDSEDLVQLLKLQDSSDKEYFKPHGFDLESIKKQFRKSSFLMMGVFDGHRLIAYFFLRFFSNRKCFVGRIVDKEYRGKGVGRVMNRIMYETAWQMKFQCLSTISRNNALVIRAHSKNENMIIRKELQDDYLLVQFVKPNSNED